MRNGQTKPGYNPVSYTHLDVYKRQEDAHDKARLQSAMYHLAEALRIIAILVSPVTVSYTHLNQYIWAVILMNAGGFH